MTINRSSKDIGLARQVCDELRSGNTNAINLVYKHYQVFFLNFAERRMYTNEQTAAETVCNDFWEELLNGKAICSYAYKNHSGQKAALKTYLTTRLNWRITDHNRKYARDRKLFSPLDDDPGIAKLNAADERMQESAEANYLREEQQKIIRQALMMLSETAPRDARLIRMYLNGLSYANMAEEELKKKGESKSNFAKKENAIKKQFTRPRTGSLAKFKICWGRVLKKKGLKQDDIVF
jgi:RNA polymerase sigma factor (sigma-70 family)